MREMIFIAATILTSPFLYAQTCNSNITRTALDSRYEVVNNGSEVKDLKTGLIWRRCTFDKVWTGNTCTGGQNTVLKSWEEVLQASQKLGGGWRVPNIKELKTLVEEGCYSPAINISLFPDTYSFYYWSSTPYSNSNSDAWVVHFEYGQIAHLRLYNSVAPYYVRFVRDN